MNTRDLLKTVRRIEVKTRRKTNRLFLGEYHSSFKGRGMVFSEVRPYAFGDDIRTIDWNKTAHFNEPYVKVFEEERELQLLFLVDVSASQNFGTRKQQKKQTAAEICATLAFSALANQDKVGLVLYSDKVETYLPPKKGKRQALKIIRELVEYTPSQKATRTEEALNFVLKTQRKGCIVFLLSDFESIDYQKTLTIFAPKHDLTALRIYDEKEALLPNVGSVLFRDSETQEMRWVNTASAKVREAYKTYYKEVKENFHQAFAKAGAGALEVRTEEEYVPILLQYFKRHGRA